MNQTLVSSKYQVVIPKEIRRKIKVKPGQKLDVDVMGEKIVLSPAKQAKELKWPHDYIKLLKKDWENIDVEKYLEQERAAWD